MALVLILPVVKAITPLQLKPGMAAKVAIAFGLPRTRLHTTQRIMAMAVMAAAAAAAAVLLGTQETELPVLVARAVKAARAVKVETDAFSSTIKAVEKC